MASAATDEDLVVPFAGLSGDYQALTVLDDGSARFEPVAGDVELGS